MEEISGVLPELNIDDQIQEVKDEELQKFLKACQSFTMFVNKDVSQNKLVEHHDINGVHYLPISYMQSMLDTIFSGLWQEVNFRWQVIKNEVTASIDLKVYHPFIKEWITRTGVSVTDKSLTNGNFAALKAECFKNACLSIGKLFGRDVNRKITENPIPIIKDQQDISGIRKKLSDKIQGITNAEQREELTVYILDIEDQGGNNYQFYESILKTL